MKRLILTLLLSVTAIHAHAQTTTPETLIPQFEGLQSRTEITAITTYKDGFVIAGSFSGSNEVESRNIIYYNGSEWEPFGPFPDPGIWSMVEFDGDLWVAGIYGGIRNLSGQTLIGPYDLVMRWDGDNWIPSKTDINGVPQTLIVYNDKLYASGYLGNNGGTNVYLRVWNGTSWEALPDQPSGLIDAMVVHEGKLIIAGAFTKVGDSQIARLAQYDGNEWEAVGPVFTDFPTQLGSFNSSIYAGGLKYVDGGSIPWMKQLKDNEWIDIPNLSSEPVSMSTYDDKMYVVLRNELGATYKPDKIGVWNGESWEHETELLDHRANGVIQYNGDIIIGGSFAQVQGEWASGLAKLDGNTLTPYSAPEIYNNLVAIYAGASKGGDLIVGGSFIRRGDRLLANIALWDGNEMFALGDGFANPVHHVVVYDEQIVAANESVAPGLYPASTMKSWDGANWNILPDLFSNRPEKLFAHDGYIYVGGTIYGQNPNRFFTRWNGTSWDWSLGIPNSTVRAIAVHDNALYVGGDFTSIDNTPINYIGKYENRSWTDMGADLDGRVRYIHSIEDSLFISGEFSVPGVNSLYNAYVRDGNEWVRPRGNLNGLITDMTKVGDIVFATGYLQYDGQSLGGLLSRWRDTEWTSIEYSLNGLIWRMLYHNGGLWVLGEMTYNDGNGLRYEAALQYQVLDLPGSFLLSAPINSVVVDSLTPTYYWTASENSTQYFMQVYDNAEYSHPPLYGDLVDGLRHKPLISLDPGATYYWRVRARSTAGETSWVNGSFSTSMTAVNLDDDDVTSPQSFTLFPAYPNPFNPSTTLRFQLPDASDVSLTVHDLLGRNVATLISGSIGSGQHQSILNASNWSSGLYFVRLSSKFGTKTTKIVLIK